MKTINKNKCAESKCRRVKTSKHFCATHAKPEITSKHFFKESFDEYLARKNKCKNCSRIARKGKDMCRPCTKSREQIITEEINKADAIKRKRDIAFEKDFNLQALNDILETMDPAEVLQVLENYKAKQEADKRNEGYLFRVSWSSPVNEELRREREDRKLLTRAKIVFGLSAVLFILSILVRMYAN